MVTRPAAIRTTCYPCAVSGDESFNHSIIFFLFLLAEAAKRLEIKIGGKEFGFGMRGHVEVPKVS
jgi:hypothetical protein